jgi:drug/metabolite transporter (DMT)-like permease
MLSALARGRLTTLAGVLLLCTDTPTYRKLRLSLPVSDARFGFAVALWRGITATLSCGAAVACMEGWSTTAMRTHVTALGVRNMLLAAALMAAASMCFTVAVGLTSAAAVLVIIALGPLITALLCRVILGAKLPAHTWAACIAGFAAVALVFAGSMEASSAVGCLVAVGCPLCFGAYLTLATHISCVRMRTQRQGATS